MLQRIPSTIIEGSSSYDSSDAIVENDESDEVSSYIRIYVGPDVSWSYIRTYEHDYFIVILYVVICYVTYSVRRAEQ